MRARLRHGEDGQGTVEWVAIVLVVAVVMGAAVAAVGDAAGPGIGGGVTRAFARALCIVRGGACDADTKPCVTASSKDTRGWHVRAFFIQLGHDQILVREERSDGTVELTKTSKTSLGVADSVGAKVAGLVDVSAGAAILANHGTGRTWKVDGLEQADRLEAAIRAGQALPEPTSTIGSWELAGNVDAGAEVEGWKAQGGFAVSDDDTTLVDAKTGERTVSVSHDEGLKGSLLFGDSSLAGDTSRSDEYSIVYDRSGQPKELILSNTVDLATSAKLATSAAAKGLPKWLAGATGALGASAAGSTTTVEAHLALDDAESSAVAVRFVDELHHPLDGGIPSAAALARLLDERAIVNALTYAVDRSSVGGGFDAGELGAGAERSAVETKLVAAASRSYDGLWHDRTDCVANGGG